MTFVRRLCVVGLIPHRPGEQLSTPIGDGGLKWLFDPAAPRSIASFWRDTTRGLVELKADEFGWRSVESSAVVDGILTNDRARNAQTACDVITGAGIPVGNYDALVIMIGGRAVGAGATGVKVNGRPMPCAFLDDRGQHTFMCHEVGHTIGMGHSFRPSWVNPGYSFGEYGDPYDIMSAMTFGDRPVSHTIPFDPAADIGQSAVMWTMAGSGVAMATLWRYLPGYPAVPPWVRVVPRDDTGTRVRLDNSLLPGNTRLVAMQDGGGGWWTVEYRPATGWDRGLQLDVNDHAGAPGLVIHRIGDLRDGTAFLPQRVSYQATIPAPSAGNDDWFASRFALRVVDHGHADASVIVGTDLPPTTAVRMDVLHTSRDTAPTEDGPEVELALTGPACGKNTYRTVRTQTEHLVEVTAGSTGFGSPVFTFLVNGQRAATGPGHDPQSGVVTFMAEVVVPTGYRTSELRSQNISARFNRQHNRLGLVLPAGDGAYSADITVKVASLGHAELAAQERIDVVTLTIDLPEAAREAQNQCEAFLALPDTSGAGALVREQIRVLTEAAAVAGMDRKAIAGRLTELSAREALHGHSKVAVEAQQAAVSVLKADPDADPLAVARSVSTLAVRLLADGRQLETIDRAGAAIEGFRQAAVKPGADIDAAAAGLIGVGRLLTSIQPPLLEPLFLGRTLRALAVAQREIGRTSEAAITAQEALDVDLSAVAGGDPMTVASELTAVAGLLSTVGLTSRGVDTQQTVVDLLRGFTPPDPQRREYLISLAEAQHNLIVRLIDDHRSPEAAAAAAPTIAAYRRYVAAADSDVWRLNRNLTSLQKVLLSIDRSAEALEAADLLVKVFATSAPAKSEHLEFAITFAEARHNLVARLIDNHRPREAAAQSAQAIAAYRHYAAETGADRPRAIRNLTELARLLHDGGLTSESQSAQHAANEIAAG